MALTVQRGNRVGQFNRKDASPVQRSSMVYLKVFNTGFLGTTDYQWLPDWARLGFWVINLEPFTVSASTSWKNNAGATIAGKINDLMDSTVLKILQGQNAFQSVATDSWTQQVVEKGSPLSCNLKFRIYYNKDNNFNEQANPTYKGLIKFFTAVSAPPRQYSLWEGITGQIGAALRNAKQMDSDIKTASEYKTAEGKTRTDYGKAIKYTLASIPQNGGFDEPGDTGHGAVRGQFTFNISTEKMGCNSLDWILKSFSWTPSQQMVIEKGKPNPLWVDFECAFETNICPSNAYVSKFMLKRNSVKVKPKNG